MLCIIVEKHGENIYDFPIRGLPMKSTYESSHYEVVDSPLYSSNKMIAIQKNAHKFPVITRLAIAGTKIVASTENDKDIHHTISTIQPSKPVRESTHVTKHPYEQVDIFHS